MEFYDFLDLMQENGLVVTLLSLLVYMFNTGRRDGFVLVVGMSCILNLGHLFYDSWVMGLSESGVDTTIVLNLWYFGFAITDFIFVFAAYLALDKLNIATSKATSFFLTCLIVRGFIQLARYVDRALIETDVLGFLYSLSIPVVNVGMVLFAVSSAAVSFNYVSKRKENA